MVTMHRPIDIRMIGVGVAFFSALSYRLWLRHFDHLPPRVPMSCKLAPDPKQHGIL